MSKKLMLICNPYSGKGAISGCLFDIVDEFSRAGYISTIYITEQTGDAAWFAQKYSREYDLIVCVGGDGTLSDTLSGLIGVENAPSVGYIPMGTTNDMASTFDLSRNPREAARRIADGKDVPFDMGKFDDHYFSYVHAFGAFTEVSFSTPQDIKRALGHLAYILEGMSKLKTIKSEHCVIEYDDGVIDDDFIFGAVTNSSSVAGLFKLPGDEVSLSDGLFEVLLIKYPKNANELGTIISNVLKRQYDPQYVYFLHTKKIRFEFDKPVAWTRDGENGGKHLIAEAENLYHAVTLRL